MTAAHEVETLKAGPILLYDGECGVCNKSVQWVLAHEGAPVAGSTQLRFTSLQSELGQALKSLAHLDDDIDSLIWAEQTESGLQVHIYSSAVYQVLRSVGGPYQLGALLLWSIPKPMRDLAYRLFASIRKQVVAEQCLVPRPEDRKRFLI